MDEGGEAIALLDVIHRDRAALRIEEGKLELRGRAVLLAGDDAAKGVFGFDRDDVARIDHQNRLGIRPIDIVEGTLPGDRELPALASLPFGNPALSHDRALDPG